MDEGIGRAGEGEKNPDVRRRPLQAISEFLGIILQVQDMERGFLFFDRFLSKRNDFATGR